MWMHLVVCSSSSSKVKCHSFVRQIIPQQHQELHEDADSWIKSGAQADTGEACSNQTSHSHQHEEQDSTECHAHRRPVQLPLLRDCNTEAYSRDCWCQRRDSGDSWWCRD